LNRYEDEYITAPAPPPPFMDAPPPAMRSTSARVSAVKPTLYTLVAAVKSNLCT